MTVRTLTSDDIVAGIKAAIEAATDGQDTERICYYGEYDVDGTPTPWGEVPHSVRDRLPIEEEEAWRRDHIVAPHCIVGVVLHNAGVPLVAMADWEETAISGIGPSQLEKYGIALDGSARDLLESVQGYQDGSYNWGEAFKMALYDNTEEEH